MTSKPVKGVKIKGNRVVRVKTYRAKQKSLAADREAKAWAKRKAPRPTSEGS
jgi:hypothetical protein